MALLLNLPVVQNNQAIANATGATLTRQVAATDAGDYHVVVTNDFGVPVTNRTASVLIGTLNTGC